MRLTLYLILFVLLTISAHGQGLRHVKGNTAFGVTAGIVKEGFNIGAQYSIYLKSNKIIKGNLLYESGNIGKTQFNLLYLNPEYLYTAARLNKSIYINLKGGLIVGYENLQNDIFNEATSIFFGENIGINAELFLTNRLSLNFDIEQRIFHKSNLGTFSPNIRMGINLIF